MNRFLLFTGMTYYADGGANDFIGSFENIEDAEMAGKNMCDKEQKGVFADDWWHVFDLESKKIVSECGFICS